jgi:DNA-binding CsgD family transcriptional regulator
MYCLYIIGTGERKLPSSAPTGSFIENFTEKVDPARWTEYLWRIPTDEVIEPERVASALRERMKELNCLYGIARLAERYYDAMEDFLKYLVDFLPLSWQYPEITCARIVFKDQTFKSRKYRVTKWRQTAQILVYNEPVGEVTIFYLEEKPAADEGPFLKEERVLLEEVARRISIIAIRISAERELQENNKQLSIERMALQEANTALRAVLGNIEAEKQRIYKDMQVNIDKVIMPILQALSVELPKAQRKYAEILKTNLEEITSPFTNRFLYQYQSLTPTEITICNMIRNGLRTKEIAQLRAVSTATINRHREHIRKKLKIANNDINLTTYLQSLLTGVEAANNDTALRKINLSPFTGTEK